MSSVGILPRFPVIPPTNLCAHHPTSVCFAAKVEPYTFFFFKEVTLELSEPTTSPVPLGDLLPACSPSVANTGDWMVQD